jgi:hypothetical protein
MNKEENQKPKFRLKKEIQEKLEAENITIEEFFQQQEQEKNDKFKQELLEYRMKYPVPPQIINEIELPNNTQNLGYERQFFNRVDAEFLVIEIENWENENSYMEIEPFADDQKEKMIQTYIATGIRYDFKNIGISLYYAPIFYQNNYDNGRALLNYGTSFYKYDHFKNEFSIVDNDDFHEISFS